MFEHHCFSQVVRSTTRTIVQRGAVVMICALSLSGCSSLGLGSFSSLTGGTNSGEEVYTVDLKEADKAANSGNSSATKPLLCHGFSSTDNRCVVRTKERHILINPYWRYIHGPKS